MTSLPYLPEVAIRGFRVIFLGHISIALGVPRSIEAVVRFIKTTPDLLSLVEVVTNSESFIFSTLVLQFCLDAQLNCVVFLTARVIKRSLPAWFCDTVQPLLHRLVWITLFLKTEFLLVKDLFDHWQIGRLQSLSWTLKFLLLDVFWR